MGERVWTSKKKQESKIKNPVPRIQKAGYSQSINSPAGNILFLQRTIGNQAVTKLIKSGDIQTRLRVSHPADSYEREADKVAEHVMRISEPGKTNRLPESVHDTLEPALGYDFSRVRVHSDGKAAEAARMLNARAFTIGEDIVFGAGQYSPETPTGYHLLAHELTHVAQQGAAVPISEKSLQGTAEPGNVHSVNPGPINHTGNTVIQRATKDDEKLTSLSGLSRSLSRITTPNPTASAPPGPSPLPPAGSFAPLSGSALTDRATHGMSTDAGTMIGEIETEVFPTGGSNPPCTPMPPGFMTTVATELSTSLQTDVPSLTPAAAPDPMAIASETATEAMPIITSHYSPHAPSRSPASFMSNVSRKPTTYGNPIRNNDAYFAEFLEWYAGDRANLRALTSNKCGMNTAWWVSFAGWTRGAGASWNAPPHSIRERSALFDTYNTSVTQGGHIQFGLAFSLYEIPHTVVHEAMHLFQHPDLTTQVNLLQNLRSSQDIFTEGFAEYLARGVRDQVITAIQGHAPPPLSPPDEARARTVRGYDYYFGKTVNIRDILYRHGQDGEESIRRAFFLGEGWRFGLLENAAGRGSPIETDRPVPGPVDVHFNTKSSVILDGSALDPIIAYVKTRSIATVNIIGRADPVGTDASNIAIGQQRALATKAFLVAAGIPAGRISTSSRGEADQIPGGNAANRRATVTVVDTRNEYPGLPAAGRP